MYSSPNTIRVIKSRRLMWAGHVDRMKEGSSTLKIFNYKSTGKRPLGRQRSVWENNIRMDHKEKRPQNEELG